MAALGVVQLQRLRHLQQKRFGDLNVAPLLEPRVPGETNAGERGHFLPTQAGRAPTAGRGQPYIDRRQLLSVMGQKGGKIAARACKRAAGQKRRL